MSNEVLTTDEIIRILELKNEGKNSRDIAKEIKKSERVVLEVMNGNHSFNVDDYSKDLFAI